MKRGGQFKFKGTSGHGGKRKGAGRPRSKDKVAHAKRGSIKSAHPLHVTMRLRPLRVSLRSNKLLKMFETCCRKAKPFGLWVNQFALMGNHLHLIIEVDGPKALARGMRSVAGRLGKAIRRAEGGCGAVFRDRFHAHVLKSPAEYLAALRYVLLNRAKHAGRAPYVDAYSSAPYFFHWEQLVGPKVAGQLRRHCVSEPAMFLQAARSWLGAVGWFRARAAAG